MFWNLCAATRRVHHLCGVSCLVAAATAADLFTFLAPQSAGYLRVTDFNIDYSCTGTTNSTSEQKWAIEQWTLEWYRLSSPAEQEHGGL